MSYCLVLVMGLLGATVEGRSSRDIQVVVDRVAAQGGGEVFLPAGTYQMDDSLHLRSRVRIRGEGEKTILRTGCVVTVEPGIYVESFGGIRIEDTVVVGERAAEILTPAPKDTWFIG